MAKNILDEIVEKRRADIERLGIDFGFPVPEKRTRKIVPFIPEKGVVLEIKRASPSKGDIAPDLDAVKTALAYVDAGTSAISVLTESNYFKGSLKDLHDVACATDKAAVLRKDFLLEEEEIEIAFRCGADAVLLIARILDDDKIVSMAKTCEKLGITAFIELRLEDDIRKLGLVAAAVDKKYIVSGVNARDLADFKIDLLTPAGVLSEIRNVCGDDARVIFESGIRTPDAAEFAGSLGFTGMLLGEAAARNPADAKRLVSAFVGGKINPATRKWLSYSERIRVRILAGEKKPLVKICGLTNSTDVRKSVELGASFLGFIFCAKSPRNISGAECRKVLEECAVPASVMKSGVVTDISSSESREALELVREGILDFVQLHGFSIEQMEEFFSDPELKYLPHYFAVNLSDLNDLDKIDWLRKKGEPRILVDSKVGETVGGTGKLLDSSLVEKVASKLRLWIAGGISGDNVSEIVAAFSPELVDVSSGVEKEKGIKDHSKMEKLFSL